MKRKKKTYSYLPDDCWESIIQLIPNDDGRRRCCLKSLSLVSKRFLSITNSLIFSLTIYPSTVPFLKRLLKRFTNLTSLDLKLHNINIDNILHLISCFPLKKLTSLVIDNHTFPANGLQAFSQNITTLTSLTCASMSFDNDLLLIANCFPLLKELNLLCPLLNYRINIINGIPSPLLSKRQLVNYQTNFINGIHSLLSNCLFIQHLNLKCIFFLNDTHVAKLSSLFHGDLVSISLNDCMRLTESSLFSLVRNCPSLSEIKMEHTAISKESVEHSGVYPQLKSLYLGRNEWLRDKKILRLASFFPNLQHLDLSGCSRVKLRGIDIVVPQLEVLNLSYTKVDDKTLYSISKNCCGLLKLLLKKCKRVTKKGVKHVVRNCTLLREISLDELHLSEINREFFSRHGCLLC